MPLDAIGFFVEPRTLSTMIAQSGITPISRQVLDAHKAAEVAKYPSHWFAPYARHYERIVAIGIIAMTVIGVAGLGGVVYGGIVHNWWVITGCALFFILCAAAVISLDDLHTRTFRIRGEAKWHESSPSVLPHMPEPIFDLAMVIRNEVPTSTFIVGRLIQDNIVLDPYLIIRDGAEEAILGIWDNSDIIKIATVT